MFKVVVFILVIFPGKSSDSFSTNSKIIDTITSSLKLSEKLFRTDRAKEVASLVSETFKNYAKSGKKSASTTNQVFTGFLKVLGFDNDKVTAIAINGLIFLAQLLGTSLMSKSASNRAKKQTNKNISSEDPFDWVSENSNMASLMANATNRNLPEIAIEYVKEKSLHEESGCVQLLICKISPFIWGMQEAFNSTKSRATHGKAALFHFLPAREEVLKRSEICEEKHQLCN